MPFSVTDRVCETTVTTGTGNITLAGAIVGYQTWNAGIGVNASGYYLIEAVDGSGLPTGDWEIGVGLLIASTTLQRLAVIASSNSNSVVTLAAGTKRVHLTAAARQIQFTGGLWNLSADLLAQNYTTEAALTWTHEQFSTEFVTPFHSVSVNTDRITLDGSRYADSTVQLMAQISIANFTANELLTIRIKDDLGSIIARNTVGANTTSPCFQIFSPFYQMSETTRYFQVTLQTIADTSIDIKSGFDQSFVQLRVIQ